MLGTLKIKREYMLVKDRLGDGYYSNFENHCYYTKVVDTSIDSADVVASLGMIHGFV